jgi:C1A family cysteine protease
LKPI